MRQRKAKDLEKRLRECSEYIVDPPQYGERFRGDVGSENPQVHRTEHDAMLRSFWDEYFPRRADLYLEIGCGKGDFIIQKALDDPASDFLAIEGQETVVLRALEKCKCADASGKTRDETTVLCSPEKVRDMWPADASNAEVRNTRSADASSIEAGRSALPNIRFMITFVDHMSDFFLPNQLSGVYLNFSDPWPKARHAKRRLTYRGRLSDYAWAVKPGGFIEIKTDNDDLYAFTLDEINAVGYEIAEQTADLHGSEYAARLVMTEYEKRFHGRGKNINYVKVIVP